MLLKSRLMTPGPTAMAESTRLAMAAAAPHHRTADFSRILKETLDGLRWLWEAGEGDDVLVISGSGTTGMEAAMATVLSPGDRVVVASSGKFGDRWATVSSLLGCEVIPVSLPWGRSILVEHVQAALEGQPQIKAFVCVASETSTGALQPVPELVETVRRHSPEALSIVDGITAVGCVDLSMQRHGIDVLVSGSQKAFGLPPGAAFIGLSDRAWHAAASTPQRSLVLDLRRERKQTTSGQTAFTPAIPLIIGLHEVMGRWKQMGREALLQHAGALSEACRLGVQALELDPFAADLPSPALTSLQLPPHIDGTALVSRLREHWGTHVAGGQDQLKGRILRIGHLGAVDPFDLLQVLAALEMALDEAGIDIDFGAAVSAAQTSMAPWMRSARPSFIRP